MVWSGTNCGTIAWSSTKYNTIFWVWLPIPTLIPAPKCNTVVYDDICRTKCNNNWPYPGNGPKCDTIVVMVLNVIISWHGTTITISQSRLPIPIPASNVYDKTCGTKRNNNVWSYPGNGAKCVSRLFVINPLCAYAVFERSTDREWHNSSGTPSDGRVDPLEQSCLGVGNSKTRRTLRQQ